MVVTIRKYKQDDIKDMVRIWNEIVEEGIHRHTVGWLRIRKAKYMDCIFFIPIMLADVVIYVMQATLLVLIREECI